MSRKLILVKHSLPEKQPDIPAAHWKLAPAGRELCSPLAAHLQRHLPTSVFASLEPKATETGQLLAASLQLPFANHPDLHEHVRGNYYPTQEEFETAVARFFANPAQQVMGQETALAAQTRFATAINSILEKSSATNPLIVAHGTVITLFVAVHNSIDSFQFWRSLGLPSFVVLDLPDFTLREVTNQIN